MNAVKEGLQITYKQVKKTLSYDQTVILRYEIDYPQFESKTYKGFLQNLNAHYDLQARKFCLRCEKRLFKLAQEQYEYSIRNRLPIQTFEAKLNYTITYNQNGALSLYQDMYEYLGGAHGNTERKADTWNILRGARMELFHFFPKTRGLKQFLSGKIIREIEKEIEAGSQVYFEDYEENVKLHYDANNFYLNDLGIVLFYQIYDLAPYVNGMQEFLFRYQQDHASPPSFLKRVR